MFVHADGPRIQITEDVLSSIEGNNITIQCSSDANPPASVTSIIKDGNNNYLVCCENSSCSLRLNGSREESGQNTCTAKNMIGEGNKTTSVRIHIIVSEKRLMY